MMYGIFYQRFFGLLQPAEIQGRTLNFSHRFLRRIQAHDLGGVFRHMQGEVWSPHGEARGLIRQLHLSHTSMSVGDVAQAPDGQLWLCNYQGWTLLKPPPKIDRPPLWMSTEADWRGVEPEIVRLKVSVDPDCLSPDAYTVERIGWVAFEDLVNLARLIEARLGWEVCLDFGPQFYETEQA